MICFPILELGKGYQNTKKKKIPKPGLVLFRIQSDVCQNETIFSGSPNPSNQINQTEPRTFIDTDSISGIVGVGEVGSNEMKMSKTGLTLKKLKENGGVTPVTSSLVMVRVRGETETTPVIWAEFSVKDGQLGLKLSPRWRKGENEDSRLPQR